MTTIKTGLVAAFTCLALLGPAHAVTIQAISADKTTIAPFALADFGNSGLNGLVSTSAISIAGGVITFGQTAGSPAAGVYDGSLANVVASPYGSTQIVPRNYLSAEPGGAVTISFSVAQTQFQLLWGSLDTYNSLLFTRADGTSTSITGSDILAADGGASTAFVTLSGLGSFTSVTALSSNPAFEFVPSVQVPEPASLSLIFIGIGALFWLRRRHVTKP